MGYALDVLIWGWEPHGQLFFKLQLFMDVFNSFRLLQK